MNYDMFSGNQFDDSDSSYVYPRPYIDPTMYMNPYYINGMPFQSQPDPNVNSNMNGYMTYMNPYMQNPVSGSESQQGIENYVEYPELNNAESDMYQMPSGVPTGPPNGSSGKLPNSNLQGMPYPPNGFIPNPPNNSMPTMSFQQNGMNMNPYMPMMPPYMPMMYPNMGMSGMYMLPGMAPISMEEFDEEEM